MSKKYFYYFFITFFLVLTFTGCSQENFQERTIFDFEKERELDLLHWKCGTMMKRDTHHATSGQYSLRLEMYSNDEYPGFRAGIIESWDGAGELLVDVYNPASSEMTLSYRIDDRKDNPPYVDRANGRLVIVPGENTLSLDLATMRTSGSGRHLDLDRICSLLFFVHRPDEKITLYLDNIRLLQ